MTSPGPITVFAPNDDAFTAFIQKIGKTKMEIMEHPNLPNTIKSHIVEGAHRLENMPDGTQLTTIAGTTITISGGAVNGAVSGIFAATGQTCIAGSRLLVQDAVYDEVVERLLALARTARMGDPMSMDTQVGPVTTRPQYDKVLSYIRIAKDEGARLLLGGGPATGEACGTGWFVQPTIFGDVDNGMRIAQEEVFGPVLSIIRFKDEDDAVRIANDVRFGLGSGVWTRDMGRAFRMSERLQAGMVWINTYRAVSFMSPFGGYKDSGLGRENGMDAINEYLQTKSVWINTGAATANPFVMR